MSKNSTLPMGYKVDWFQCTEDGTEKILKLSESNFFRFLLEIGYENDKFQEISGRYFYEKGLTLGNYLNIFFNECENPYTKASVYFQFTGQGSTDLAQKLAVELEIPDTRKRKMISEKTGLNIDNAIMINHMMNDDNGEEEKADAPKRKTTP